MDSLTNQPGNQAPQFIIANQEEESGFDFWGVLNRRKWLVFLGLVTGMGLGGLYNAQCEDVFESKAMVRIEPKNPARFRMTSTDPLGPNMADFVVRHDRFIGQHNIVYKTIQDLLDLPSFEEIPEDKVIEEVMDNLEITPDREEPSLYELVYHCNNADDARTVLNTLLATYKEELDEEFSDAQGKYVTLLLQVRSEFKTNYERLQEMLREIRKEHKAPIIGQGGLTIHEISLRELGQTINESQARISNYSAEKERLNKALVGGPEAIKTLVWILNQDGKIKDLKRDYSKDITEIEMSINQLMLNRGELTQRYGPSHPQVRAIDTQIEFWQSHLAEVQNQNAEIEIDTPDSESVLKRYLLSLNQRIANEQVILDKSIKDWALHESEAQRLANVNREIDAIQSEMNDIKEFMKIAQQKTIEFDPSMQLTNADREGFDFDVIMSATYGELVWPFLPVILGIGGLLGSLAGFGLGCLVELADQTFHNPDEIMKQLRVPLIGHVPVIGQSKRYLVENSLIEPIVCTYHRPKSQVSESFRAVRTALYFNTQGKQHSVIQVTSPTPGDGKSTLSSNLAVSIAQSGKRVLLVDGDMRRPRQAPTFGITSKTGFATVLSGESQWRDVVYECEEIEGLTIMPCGSKPNNPAELSSSPQVKELIEEMRREFDFVIIDTPPLLAVTDACPIAARVDGVVLCIRIKKNVRVSAERATEMLANLGANCIGLVVNGVGAQSGYGSQYTYGAYRAGYSYNGYGYGYGYGYGAGKYYEEDRSGRPGPNPIKHIEAQHSEY